MKPKLFTLIKNRPEEFTWPRILKEMTSGLVVAIIAIPLSIALAIASGVGPEKGLLTAVIGGFVAAVFGGSRVQVSGPTGAFVIIVLGIVEKYGMTGLLAATFTAGIFLIAMGVLRFGSVIKFIPYPVIAGFTAGIAVVLFSTQINDFFGLGLLNVPGEFFAKWQVYFESFSNINFITLGIGLLSLFIIIFWPKRFKYFPGMLAAVVITTLLVYFFNLDTETIFSRFGALGKPSLAPHAPDLNLQLFITLLPASFTIAMLAGIESLLSAVVADGMTGKRHRSNAELIAQGAANIASSLFGGLPVTGTIARTAANVNNGARTPLSAIFHALFVLLAMLMFMKVISLVPMACLAAVLFIVCWRMSHVKDLKNFITAPKADVLVFLTTFTLTVVKDLVVAIEVGVVLAAVLFMKRMSDVYKVDRAEDNIFDELEDDKDPMSIDKKVVAEHVKVYEINGPFFFGAANVFVETLENIKDCKVLILRMRSVPAMDMTGFNALQSVYKICKKQGIELVLSHVQPQPMRLMERQGFAAELGKERFCKNIDAALKKARELLKN